MAADHVGFIRQELQGILEPGEQVHCIGLTTGSKSWLISVILLKKLRRFFYTVFTDRRLILIRAKTKASLFGTKPVPANKEVKFGYLHQIKSMVHSDTTSARLATLLFKVKAYAIAFEGGPNLTLIVKRTASGFPDQQAVFDRFLGMLAQAKQLTVVTS